MAAEGFKPKLFLVTNLVLPCQLSWSLRFWGSTTWTSIPKWWAVSMRIWELVLGAWRYNTVIGVLYRY